MSWLNLNDSLNNLKGQISSFASGVLADGIVNDNDPFKQLEQATKKIEELQNLCASQDLEIKGLRKQNSEFYEKLSHRSIENNVSNISGVENEENWFWDPPSTDITDSKESSHIQTDGTVSHLRTKITELEHEKLELAQNLEQLDLDCQNTTDKLVTLKDGIQSKYNKLKVDYDMLKVENDLITKDKLILEKELLKVKDVNFVNVDLTSTTVDETVYGELKLNFDNLTIQSEEKITNLQEELKKLTDDLKKMQNEFDLYKAESVPLEKYKKIVSEFEILQNKFTELEEKNINAQETIYQLNSDFEDMKLNDKTDQQINLSDDHKKLQDMFEELKNKYEIVLQERKEMHKKYVSILTDNVKKYVDHDIPDEFIQKPNENPQYSEFSSKVEIILKLLLDFKWKTETLEKKLCEISHEKSVAIAEKNHEIEKLLHNSEILSQEVITKTQTIKDYEIECSELIKNNDLLISELQKYKNNNSGLQTISESNEDNLLLMETQLENANKRIRELELAISDMENAKQDIALETQTELDYIKKQLNMTGRELSQSKKEHQELLVVHKRLEADNELLNKEFNNMKLTYEMVLQEKQSCETNLEKIKNDIENIEYRFTETNINFETISEELKSTKFELSNTIKNNETLEEVKNELDVKNNKYNKIQQKLDKLKSENEKFRSSEIQLKSQNDDLKKELDLATNLKINLQQKCDDAETQYIKLKTDLEMLCQVKNASIDNCLEILKSKVCKDGDDEINNQKLHSLQNQYLELENKFKDEETKNAELEKKFQEKRNEVSKLEIQNFELTSKISLIEADLTNVHSSKNELMNRITAKHQENIQYYNEIQRLNQIIAAEMENTKMLQQQLEIADNSTLISQKNVDIDRLSDQNTFLKEKCEKLAQNLLEEQSNTQKILAERQVILDREQSLTKELERLREHLVEIEDSYTQELVHAEQRNQEMQVKVNEVEQRERDSSTIYTSVNIRANQQVETLQNQLQLVTVQRDELQRKISEGEDKYNKKLAALTNLQCVLEQFQRDKEKDIFNETERIRRQIKVEKEKQNQLQTEINTLKAQLENSKEGLKAASRLTEQMEKSKQQVVTMKEEVTKLQDKLTKTEEKYNCLLIQTEMKVDKALIRNLIIGFISANNNLNKDQTQILKIIAIVLDFSRQDNEKVNLNRINNGSWLSAILHPQTMLPHSNMSQQSLSEAFVKFLEVESQPKVLPTLIDVSKINLETATQNGGPSRQTTALLNEVRLPTFADFAQSRNSSSILKDVLKEN